MTEEKLIRDLSKIEKAIHRNVSLGGRQTDAGLKKQYYKDASELDKVANAIRTGDNKKASRLIYNLDTLVRDQIPARLYNYVMKSF